MLIKGVSKLIDGGTPLWDDALSMVRIFLLVVFPFFSTLPRASDDDCVGTLSAATVFRGASSVSRDRRGVYGSMHFKMEALEDALEKCLKSGARLCGIQAVGYKKLMGSSGDGDDETLAQAVVLSLDGLPLAKGGVFSDEARLFYDGFDTSSSLRFLALEKALVSCFGAGHHFCVLLTTASSTNGNDLLGRASVMGFLLDLDRLKI